MDNQYGVQQGIVFKIDTKENTADIGIKSVEVQLFMIYERERLGCVDVEKKGFGKDGVLEKPFSGGMSEDRKV